jgi:predicted dehydrogenase
VVRWGILAPGEIAEAWTKTLHANTDQRVVAVGSRNADRAAAFAIRHGIPRSYGSYEQLAADPEVDVVYVAPPHTEHARLALLAISAGKHVLIEKPMAVSEAEARVIVDAARQAGVFAMEAMWSRFLPQTTILDRLLRDGALGELHRSQADFGDVFPYDPASRAFDPALGGGSLLDIGIYSLWFTRFALGAPLDVLAVGTMAATGVDEQATVVTRHAGGHAIGISSATMVSPTGITAMVAGTLARLEVDQPFCAPGGFRLVADGPGRAREELRWEDPTDLRWRDGLCYQATAVAAHVLDGRTEAPEHSLDTTLGILGTIDEARRQVLGP